MIIIRYIAIIAVLGIVFTVLMPVVTVLPFGMEGGVQIFSNILYYITNLFPIIGMLTQYLFLYILVEFLYLSWHFVRWLISVM